MTNNNADHLPTLRIDVKNSRIHIHTQTLKLLGDPKYICFGFQQQTKNFLVFRAKSGEKRALRIRLNKEGSCYVHSKAVIQGIRSASGLLSEDGSYLFKGVFTQNIPGIAFSIEQAAAVMGGRK